MYFLLSRWDYIPPPCDLNEFTLERMGFLVGIRMSWCRSEMWKGFKSPNYNHPPLNDMVKSLDSIFNSEYVFLMKTTQQLSINQYDQCLQISEDSVVLLCRNLQNMGVSLGGGVRVFLAKSAKHPLLNISLKPELVQST